MRLLSLPVFTRVDAQARSGPRPAAGFYAALFFRSAGQREQKLALREMVLARERRVGARFKLQCRHPQFMLDPIGNDVEPVAFSAYSRVMGVLCLEIIAFMGLDSAKRSDNSPPAQRQFAKHMAATTIETASSHVAMASHPQDTVICLRAPQLP